MQRSEVKMPFKDALNVMEKCSKAVNETFAELVYHSFHSQYFRNFKRIKRQSLLTGLLGHLDEINDNDSRWLKSLFTDPDPGGLCSCWRHLSPPPETSVCCCCCQSGGADARNAALGRITQLESDWNTRIMKNSLSNSAAAAWLRSKFSFLLHTFLLLRHSKMSSHEFKCKSVRASLDSGCVFVGIWHSASGWLWFSALYFCFCIVRTFNFISRKAPLGWIKVVLSLDWVITASNMWKDKCIRH